MQGSLESLVTSTNASDLSRSTHGLPILNKDSRLSAATGMFPGRLRLMDTPCDFRIPARGQSRQRTGAIRSASQSYYGTGYIQREVQFVADRQTLEGNCGISWWLQFSFVTISLASRHRIWRKPVKRPLGNQQRSRCTCGSWSLRSRARPSLCVERG